MKKFQEVLESPDLTKLVKLDNHSSIKYTSNMSDSFPFLFLNGKYFIGGNPDSEKVTHADSIETAIINFLKHKNDPVQVIETEKNISKFKKDYDFLPHLKSISSIESESLIKDLLTNGSYAVKYKSGRIWIPKDHTHPIVISFWIDYKDVSHDEFVKLIGRVFSHYHIVPAKEKREIYVECLDYPNLIPYSSLVEKQNKSMSKPQIQHRRNYMSRPHTNFASMYEEVITENPDNVKLKDKNGKSIDFSFGAENAYAFGFINFSVSLEENLKNFIGVNIENPSKKTHLYIFIHLNTLFNATNKLNDAKNIVRYCEILLDIIQNNKSFDKQKMSIDKFLHGNSYLYGLRIILNRLKMFNQNNIIKLSNNLVKFNKNDVDINSIDEYLSEVKEDVEMLGSVQKNTLEVITKEFALSDYLKRNIIIEFSKIKDIGKEIREFLAPSGRFWKETKNSPNIISFWCKKPQSSNDIEKLLAPVLSGYKIKNTDNLYVEFLNTKPTLYPKLLNPNYVADFNLSDTQYNALLKKKHEIGAHNLSSDEQKQIKKIQSDRGLSKIERDAKNAGFDDVAGYRLSNPKLHEYKIKSVKSLIKEDPHDVKSGGVVLMDLMDDDVSIFGFLNNLEPVFGDNSIDVHPELFSSVMMTYSPSFQNKSIEECIKYLKNKNITVLDSFYKTFPKERGIIQFKKMSQKQTNGEEYYRQMLYPCGRMWKDRHVISFWAVSKDVTKTHLDKLFELLHNTLGTTIDYNKWFVEFLDAPEKLVTINEFLHGGITSTSSEAEINKLIQKKHLQGGHNLTSSEKEKLKRAGFLNQHSKNDDNYETEFERRMNKGLHERKIKSVKDVVTETPDNVFIDGEKYHWGKENTRCFGFIQGKYLIGHDFRASTHSDLYEGFVALYKDADGKSYTIDKYAANNSDIVADEFLFKNRIIFKNSLDDILPIDKVKEKREFLYPCGRLWVDKKILSFWASKQFVKDHHFDSIFRLYNIHDKENWYIEFLDTLPVLYKNIHSVPVDKALSYKYNELMMKKHLGGAHNLSTSEQETLQKINAERGLTTIQQKARDAGFDNVLAYRMARGLHENSVKKYLKEDPDAIKIGKKFYEWDLPGTHSFAFIDKKYFFGELDDMVAIPHKQLLIRMQNMLEMTDMSERNKYIKEKYLIFDNEILTLPHDKILNIDSESPYIRQYISPAGRIWLKEKAISFWTKSGTVTEDMIHKIAKYYNIEKDLDDYVIQFIDTYTEPIHKMYDIKVNSMSDTEYNELIKKKHLQGAHNLTLDEKEKLSNIRKERGLTRIEKEALDAGYESVLAYRSDKGLHENSVKKYLKEHPDEVSTPLDSPLSRHWLTGYVLRWRYPEARTFGFLDKKYVIGYLNNFGKKTHGDLFDTIRYAASGKDVMKYLSTLSITWNKSLNENELLRIIGGFDANDDYRKVFFPSGRVWVKSKVISFWARFEEVTKEQVEQVAAIYKLDINDKQLTVDFLDKEVTLFSELYHPKSTSVKTLTDLEYNELMKKKHLKGAHNLTPDEKEMLSDIEKERGLSPIQQKALDAGFDSVFAYKESLRGKE